MPRYDYRCPKCNELFEVVHPMDSTDIVLCPVCESEATKVFYMPSVNWGGLAPSQGELHPQMKQFIEDAPRRRDNQTPHQSNRLAEINRRAQHG